MKYIEKCIKNKKIEKICIEVDKMKKKIDKKLIRRISVLVGLGTVLALLMVSSVSAIDPFDWSFGGNAFPGGTTQAVGTTTADDLMIVTGQPGVPGGTQRILIDGITGTGHVGIGNPLAPLPPGWTFPSVRLHVHETPPALANGNIYEVGRIGVTNAPSTPNPTDYAIAFGVFDDPTRVNTQADPVIQGFDQAQWNNPNEPESGVPLYINPNPNSDPDWTGGNTILNLISGSVGIGDSNIDGTFEVNPNRNEDDGDEFMVDLNGYVGIGTTSPGAKLDVRGSAIFNEDGDDNDFRIEGDSDTNLFFVDASTDRIGIGTATPNAKLDVRGSAIFNEDGDDNDFRIEGDTDTDLFFVDASTDRIGIGVSNPGATLDIDGKIHIFHSGNSIIENTDNTAFLYMASAHGAGISADTRMFFKIDDDANSGDQYFRWQTDNGCTDLMHLNEAGNLGIGTTSPNSILELADSSQNTWLTMDEADANPTSTQLDTDDSVSIYNKADKFVIAYNNGGTITYLYIDLDGSDTTWTHTTTAP